MCLRDAQQAEEDPNAACLRSGESSDGSTVEVLQQRVQPRCFVALRRVAAMQRQWRRWSRAGISTFPKVPVICHAILGQQARPSDKVTQASVDWQAMGCLLQEMI